MKDYNLTYPFFLMIAVIISALYVHKSNKNAVATINLLNQKEQEKTPDPLKEVHKE
jgi:hypothetical protein